MDHCLFVASQVITEAGPLLQRLTHTSYIAMAKYTPHAGKELSLFSIALDKLILQKRDQRLGCC